MTTPKKITHLVESIAFLNAQALRSLIVPRLDVLPKIDFTGLINHVEGVSNRLREASKILISQYQLALLGVPRIAQEGWFIEFSDLSPGYYFDLIDQIPDMCNCDDVMGNHYRHSLPRIKDSLLNRHLSRQSTIEQVFEGHNLGLYSLTIPALFALTDGICQDHLNTSFFDKNKNRDYELSILQLLEGHDTGLARLFKEAIRNNNPAYSHEQQLKEFSCKLNRHRIMHGHDSNYGTEINSLKCIGLLKYVSDLLIMNLNFAKIE